MLFSKKTDIVSNLLIVCLLGSIGSAQERPSQLWEQFRDRDNEAAQRRRMQDDELRPNAQSDAQRPIRKDSSRPRTRPTASSESAIRTASASPKRTPKLPDVAAPPSDNRQWWDEEANASADFSRSESTRGETERGDLIASSQIIAIVGNEPILAGDLLGRINEALQPYAGKVPEKELEMRRWQLIEQLLPSAIESKMVYLDFVRKMKPEQIAALRGNIYSQFDEKQLPVLVEKAGVRNVTELEAKMRAVGGSLDKTRRLFFEQVAAREVIRRGGQVDLDISPADLWQFYNDHLEEFAIEAKAKWEQLMVKVPSYASEEEVRKAKFRLGRMGNAVLDGVPFATVAKCDSDGPTAHLGGVHDWTVKGSLVSTALDKAIFELPIGRLSNIIRDENGVHIVRVIERVEAGHVPFVEAQRGIRERMENEARDAKIKAYLEELKNRTFVWNYFTAKKAESERQQARQQKAF